MLAFKLEISKSFLNKNDSSINENKGQQTEKNV